MYNFHSVYLCYTMVWNMYVIKKNQSINVRDLCYNGHIVLNCTVHFVEIPLNSYLYIHWILDVKYILLYNDYITRLIL